MALHRLNEIWEIIKMNNFETSNEISYDLLCLFCKKISINAHSGPCGCIYCFECINNFLKDSEAFCPGATDDCKEELLNINYNVHIENSVNRRISQLIVKCPERGCQIQSELRNFENHKRVCNFRSENCPYFNIGCKQSNVALDSVKNHLLDEIILHSKLLLELVNNLENEKEMLRNEMEILKNKTFELGEDNKLLKNEIERMRSNRNNNELKITALERKESANRDEILELNEDMVFVKNENRALRKAIENLEKKGKETKPMPTREVGKVNQISKEMDEFIKDIIDTKLINLQKQIFSLEKKVGKKEIPCEFEWVIDNFHQKWYKTEQNDKIFSSPFYSHKNGYKLCLCLFPTGHFTSKRKSLAIDFHIMKGEYDDYLPWPFTHGVKISLINQSSGVAGVCIPLEFEDCPINEGWQKPITDINKPINFIKLIDIVHLLKNNSLYMNDQIILKCQTNIII